MLVIASPRKGATQSRRNRWDPATRLLAASGAEASKVGTERARELLRAAPRYAAGAYFIAPFRSPAEILHLLDEEDG